MRTPERIHPGAEGKRRSENGGESGVWTGSGNREKPEFLFHRSGSLEVSRALCRSPSWFPGARRCRAAFAEVPRMDRAGLAEPA